ncbi:MAG TPA: SGNH/GDSL hydrolase family protein [Trichocoleus sp.]|jgi:hypothetical protein
MFTRRRTWSSRWKRKSQRRRPWLPILLLLVGVPVGLELLARAIVSATGTTEQLIGDPSGKSTIIQAYQLGFHSPTGQAYRGLPHQGSLQALRDPLRGYQLQPQQQNQFLTINPQGFRDPDSVKPEKPEGEVRIFVLGGSMAFGQLSSSDEVTFAQQLEKLLNDRVAGQRAKSAQFQPAVLPYRADQVGQALALPPRIPERQYRVINAAVPGYASGNELSMLMQQVANYNPDMVLVLNSYEDLLLPSGQSGTDIPGLDGLIEGKREGVDTQIKQAVQGWFDGLYLVRATKKYVLRSSSPEQQQAVPLNLLTGTEQPLDQSLPKDGKELDQRVARYRNHLLQIARWSSATKKRLLIGIQPEISTRQEKVITPQEKAILTELGGSYTQRIQPAYTKLVSAAKQVTNTSANIKLLDLHQLYATTPGQVFQSPTSLTDEANGLLAKQFFDSIVQQMAIEPRPYGS